MKKTITLLLLGLFMISFASAYDWDNVFTEGSINPNTGYPNLEIKNCALWAGIPGILGTCLIQGESLFEGSLVEHTPVCEDCYSKFETNHNGGVFIDDIRFMTLREDGSWVEQNVRNYRLKYEAELPQYETECEIIGQHANGSDNVECTAEQVGTYTGFKTYNIGESLPQGSYDMYLEANKRPSRTVDWQIKVQGRWLTEWATWGNISTGDDAEVILNSPTDNYTVLTNPQEFNCSANVTGGAYLVNISLWTNETGTWEAKNNTNIAVSSSNLITYYKMNDNLSTTNIIDSIDNNNGTLVGGDNTEDISTTGILNLSLNLDGSSDYINTSGGATFDFVTADDFSFSFWINPDVTTTGRIFSNDGGSGIGYQIALVGGSKIQFWGDTSNITLTDDTIALGAWQHIVVTSEAGSVKIYINASTPKIGTFETTSSSNNLLIGADPTAGPGSFYNGKIDEVGIWNRVLNSTEISQIYNSGLGALPGQQTYINQQWNRIISTPTLWTCQACDTDGACGFAEENRTVIKDTSLPTITLEAPTGVLNYNYVGGNETLNVTFTDINLDSCWYDYNNTIVMIDGCKTGVKNSTNFILEYSNNNMLIYANDSVGNENSISPSWTYNLVENSQTSPTTSVESSTETYIANLTYYSANFNVITASLYINGTSYLGTRTGTGDNAIFTTNVIMPSIESETNITSNWVVSLTNATGTTNINLTSNNVTVEIINFSLCDANNNVPFWNFTILNETNLVEVNSTFEATFGIKTVGSTTNNQFSFSDVTGTNSQFDFCISPGNFNYVADASIKLTKAGFVDKFYNYQSVSISNSTREDNLYMMASADSTSFIVHTVYVDSSDLVGAEVRVQRYYQGTGAWLTTEILTTNYVGEAVGHLLSEDADYRFLVYTDGTLLYTSAPTKITCAVSPCTVTLTLPINVPTGVEEVEDFTSSLTYSDTTNIFTYTYSDTSGDFTSARLYVTKILPSNATKIIACNDTKTTASGVITCDITGQTNGTYQASGYLTRDEETLTNRINGVLGNNIYNVMDLDGVLWAFFILIAIIMLGINRPSMAIVFGTVGLVFVGLMGIIKIGAISIVAVTAIAVILLMRVGRE